MKSLLNIKYSYLIDFCSIKTFHMVWIVISCNKSDKSAYCSRDEVQDNLWNESHALSGAEENIEHLMNCKYASI